MENAADLIADADEDVAAFDQEIEDYNAQIRRLQSRVISLRNERQHLSNYRTCLRGLKSPLQKLANELLLLIFEYACDMNEITSKQLRTMPTLVISGVCWRWRNLARSFPALWSHIDISLGRTPPRLSGLPVLGLFLRSSQKSPLTIQISSTQAICVTIWMFG
ncbi:hypothetical protein BDP27DRAFT_1208765 [Rhodocollybia butyracea]|uniref:F-box domain-containing protein n=1 Tax=Rhodocollybia butyracea TaxID=206335 RepID=A0A9P5Q482_9AGAR|nr:hypothetical protein BDP27DRAFT_1208765 [Rhodocollybia butyracea]